MPITYGKKVQWHGGPIVPRFEHRCTSPNSAMPEDVASLCYPQRIGIGTSDLTNWRHYPWLEQGRLADGTSVNAGGLTLQAHYVNDCWWMIAGRTRARSEGIEGDRDNRYYVQARFLAQKVGEAGDWIHCDLPNNLVAIPDVDGGPTEQSLAPLTPWSAARENLPENWYESAKPRLLELLCGRPVTVIDSSIHPDTFFFEAMICLACLPGAMRWRIPIGAGHFPVDTGKIALGHGADLLPYQDLPLGSEACRDAEYYLEWLESQSVPNARTLSELIETVDKGLPQFAPWGSLLCPDSGKLQWTEEVRKLRIVARELHLLEQLKRYVHDGAGSPPEMSFKFLQTQVITEVAAGLEDEEANRRSNEILSECINWTKAWQRALEAASDKRTFQGIICLFHGGPISREWLPGFVSRISLSPVFQQRLNARMTELVCGDQGLRNVESKKDWCDLLTQSPEQSAKSAKWFRTWLDQNPVVQWCAACERAFDGSPSNLPGDFPIVKSLADGTDVTGVQLKQFEKSIKNYISLPAPFADLVSAVLTTLRMHLSERGRIAEHIVISEAMRLGSRNPGDLKEDEVHEIARRFSVLKNFETLRRVILCRWQSIPETLREGLAQDLAIPMPYGYILLNEKASTGNGSGLSKVDTEFLKEQLKRTDSDSVLERALAHALKRRDLQDQIVEALKIRSRTQSRQAPLGEFLSRLIGQRRLQSLPELAETLALHVSNFLESISFERQSMDPLLVKKVRNLAHFRAYCIAARSGESFPEESVEIIVDAMMEVATNPDFWKCCLKRIGIHSGWRILQIQHEPPSRIQYSVVEALAIARFLKRRSDNEENAAIWLLRFVARGWPIPSDSKGQMNDVFTSKVFTADNIATSQIDFDSRERINATSVLVSALEDAMRHDLAKGVLRHTMNLCSTRMKEERLARKHISAIIGCSTLSDRAKRAWKNMRYQVSRCLEDLFSIPVLVAMIFAGLVVGVWGWWSGEHVRWQDVTGGVKFAYPWVLAGIVLATLSWLVVEMYAARSRAKKELGELGTLLTRAYSLWIREERNRGPEKLNDLLDSTFPSTRL